MTEIIIQDEINNGMAKKDNYVSCLVFNGEKCLICGDSCHGFASRRVFGGQLDGFVCGVCTEWGIIDYGWVGGDYKRVTPIMPIVWLHDTLKTTCCQHHQLLSGL